jgi:hypothetical protein
MKVRSVLLSAVLLAVSTGVLADEMLKPFVLASKSAGSVAGKVAEVKAALQGAGFTVAGEYAPYAGADIIIVTNDELKKNAAASEFGGYGAVERVAVTQAGKEIQVSYNNPEYMAGVYRMNGNLSAVAATLSHVLGNVEAFGSARGMSAKAARKYHYMMGMEYFTDPVLLTEYGSHEEALKAVDEKLSNNKNGVSKVYRVDVPGKQESVFGVGLKGNDENKTISDKFIMDTIDTQAIKSTAHLPLEVLVSGAKVYTLHGHFRIAFDFPDLSMMGAHSFMSIKSSPDAILKVLKATLQK